MKNVEHQDHASGDHRQQGDDAAGGMLLPADLRAIAVQHRAAHDQGQHHRRDMEYADVIDRGQEIGADDGDRDAAQAAALRDQPGQAAAPGIPGQALALFQLRLDRFLRILALRRAVFLFGDLPPQVVDDAPGDDGQPHGDDHDHFRPQGQERVQQEKQRHGQDQGKNPEARDIQRHIRHHLARHAVGDGIEHALSAADGHEPGRRQRRAGIFRPGDGNQLLFRLLGAVGAAVVQIVDHVLQPVADRLGPGKGQVFLPVRVRNVGVISADVGGGEGPEGVLRHMGDLFAHVVRHFAAGVVPDMVVLVVQVHRRVVVIGVVPLGIVPLEGRVPGDGGGVFVLGNIDSPEAFRRHALFQPVIRAQAFRQRFLIRLEALLPRDLKRRDPLRRLHVALLLFQQHRRAAVAAEGGLRGVQRLDFRPAGRTGQQIHAEAGARVARLLLVRFLNRHRPVAPSAFQRLRRDVEHHARSASGTSVHFISLPDEFFSGQSPESAAKPARGSPR